MNPNSGDEAKQEGPEPLRIMLIGKSGAGKSSSGNTILNKKVFRSDMKLKRVTVYCEKEDGMVDDSPVSVIDTPGLFEKERKNDKIVREILQRVKLQEPGPHVFVFVIPLGRMTQEDQNTNTLIQEMFGPRVWDFTMVLFTHGDRLEDKSINDVITESDDNLRSFIRKCSGGFHVFNNKNPEDPSQVTTLVQKIQTLKALNGGGFYKTELYPEEERKTREKQESILKEKDHDISKTERNLKERFKGEELKTKIKELWRKEEESSRKAAEEFISQNSYLMKTLRVILLVAWMGLLIGWALQLAAEDPNQPAIDPNQPAIDPNQPAIDPNQPARDPNQPARDPNQSFWAFHLTAWFLFAGAWVWMLFKMYPTIPEKIRQLPKKHE